MTPRTNGSPSRLFFRAVFPTLALLFSLGFAAPGHALTPAEIDAGARAAQRIQNEQQERLQQQMREDALRRGQAAPQETPQVEAPSLPRTGVCRDIKEIALLGVKLLSEGEKRALTAPYLNRCLYAEDIEKLLADILKAYMDRGYVSVRPYVQAQDLTAGRLEILIVEGKIEGLILKDSGGWFSANLATAFPFVSGKPLNLRDIEQGLDQINRLASNSATMEVSPGSEPGASVVTITNTPKVPLSVSGTMDNLGGLSTGRHQGAYTVSLDNPLGLNDFITYTHRNTLFESTRLRESISDSFFYSLPFGAWTMQLSYSASEYHSPVTTSSTTLVARGTSETFRAELNWVAYRDQDQKLTALVAINNKATRNYLDDQFLSVSSRNLAIADADLNWQRRFSWLFANLGLGFSKGLRQLDAKADPSGTGVTAPHAQGAKVRYSGGATVPFSLFGQELTFSSQATGQYALEPLYGSEQITIGSFYTVRGFNRYSLSGDRGWYVRNELSATLGKLPFTDISPRPFIGFDGGRIEGFKTTRNANLTGVAGGVRLAGKHMTGELSAAKSLSTPVLMPHEPVQFSATMTLSF
ncbi:MAG: ShlB/FhaC/HecB family hemolysin secretion/activation protein [Humidesulfovibrio sp.]|uniref:ShlB/FhaC/HecB family hemolysin secretion/activation protein n=1 Tax=Humidesulfovibrio sp. TaxID=2910988 RepID=UPI0027350153|nr:ShlB/FhaC/HecB family hemolysin secretion/activation protein [Humidesulfovibrio sp.]MDP2849300.1 ShlB/FhaC/HecB family hemolysin secretion/activation protein [Humidesulfovibrio sp.]